jgi:hypothetical protein
MKPKIADECPRLARLGPSIVNGVEIIVRFGCSGGRAAMIDWKRVEELRTEIGNDGFAEVAEMFLEEAEATVQTLVSGPRRMRWKASCTS